MRQKAPAKINIFLKITGTRGDYHTLASRFVRYEELYDVVSFEPSPKGEFWIEGVDIPIEQNIITKAYQLLQKATQSSKLIDFFAHHIVRVEKNIPQGAGLGGGSSDAAAFMLLANEVVGLGLSIQELANIGVEAGADVPFFIYDYPSANVTGIGEVIEPFEEELPDIELHTLPLACDTAKVYRHFRSHYLDSIDTSLANRLLELPSSQILERFTPIEANDLYKSAKDLCPTLEKFAQTYYLSGSGSSLFRKAK